MGILSFDRMNPVLRRQYYQESEFFKRYKKDSRRAWARREKMHKSWTLWCDEGFIVDFSCLLHSCMSRRHVLVNPGTVHYDTFNRRLAASLLMLAQNGPKKLTFVVDPQSSKRKVRYFAETKNQPEAAAKGDEDYNSDHEHEGETDGMPSTVFSGYGAPPRDDGNASSDSDASTTRIDDSSSSSDDDDVAAPTDEQLAQWAAAFTAGTLRSPAVQAWAIHMVRQFAERYKASVDWTVYMAPIEADRACAKLARERNMAVITEDSDIMVLHGAPFIIRRMQWPGGSPLRKPGRCLLVCRDEILESLDISETELFLAGIIAPNDYARTGGVTFRDAVDLVKKLRRIIKDAHAKKHEEDLNGRDEEVDYLEEEDIEAFLTEFKKLDLVTWPNSVRTAMELALEQPYFTFDDDGKLHVRQDYFSSAASKIKTRTALLPGTSKATQYTAADVLPKSCTEQQFFNARVDYLGAPLPTFAPRQAELNNIFTNLEQHNKEICDSLKDGNNNNVNNNNNNDDAAAAEVPDDVLGTDIEPLKKRLKKAKDFEKFIAALEEKVSAALQTPGGTLGFLPLAAIESRQWDINFFVDALAVATRFLEQSDKKQFAEIRKIINSKDINNSSLKIVMQNLLAQQRSKMHGAARRVANAALERGKQIRQEPVRMLKALLDKEKFAIRSFRNLDTAKCIDDVTYNGKKLFDPNSAFMKMKDFKELFPSGINKTNSEEHNKQKLMFEAARLQMPKPSQWYTRRFGARYKVRAVRIALFDRFHDLLRARWSPLPESDTQQWLAMVRKQRKQGKGSEPCPVPGCFKFFSETTKKHRHLMLCHNADLRGRVWVFDCDWCNFSSEQLDAAFSHRVNLHLGYRYLCPGCRVVSSGRLDVTNKKSNKNSKKASQPKDVRDSVTTADGQVFVKTELMPYYNTARNSVYRRGGKQQGWMLESDVAKGVENTDDNDKLNHVFAMEAAGDGERYMSCGIFRAAASSFTAETRDPSLPDHYKKHHKCKGKTPAKMLKAVRSHKGFEQAELPTVAISSLTRIPRYGDVTGKRNVFKYPYSIATVEPRDLGKGMRENREARVAMFSPDQQLRDQIRKDYADAMVKREELYREELPRMYAELQEHQRKVELARAELRRRRNQRHEDDDDDNEELEQLRELDNDELKQQEELEDNQFRATKAQLERLMRQHRVAQWAKDSGAVKAMGLTED